MHDVVVVGGGPAGCYAASLLGERGFDVHVLEEHPVIGEPVDCSGVIGAEAFETLGLPNSLKLGEIHSLILVSPSKLEVHFSPPSPLAYIVDRAAFDRAIAEKTSVSGVTFHLASRVVDLRVLRDCVEVTVKRRVVNSQWTSASSVEPSIVNGHLGTAQWTNDQLPITNDSTIHYSRFTIHPERLRARMVILAGGPRYRLQRKLGMGEPGDFLRTAQAEVTVQGIEKTMVLMGSQVAPGSFAWIVPFRRGEGEFARIGVSAKTNAIPYLKQLLDHLNSEGHLCSGNASIRSWVIPITPIQRTFAERVLAVGDAAGQTKPTTGGGIFYGLLCAEAAALTAAEAFKKGDFSAATMSRYEEEWQKRLGREIRSGAFFRRLAERLTDKEIDDLFRIVQSDGILASVTSKARFDWHRDVIYFALRHPALGRIFLKGLFR